MNGRVFDTNIGRFIQADIVNDSGIQGLNPYSYVLNNPFSLTDPSGYLSFGDVLKIVASVAIMYFTAGAGASTLLNFLGVAKTGVSSFLLAVGGGFVSGAITTGSLKGALIGALSAGVFHGIGSYFEGANWAHIEGNLKEGLNAMGRYAKTVAHGMAGGVMNVLQGGKFGHGFVSAGAAQAISPAISDMKSIGFSGRVVVAAIAGGTVSELTGGKFANGAVTGAFSRAFNDETESTEKQSESQKKIERKSENRKLPSINDLRKNYPSFGDKRPARPSSNPEYINQCAIRISVALQKSGFDLSTYPKVNQTDEGWARSAKGLADYLWIEVGKPKIMQYSDFLDVNNDVNYKNFNGVFFQKDIPHIDIMRNQYTGSGIHGSRDEIWLWEIK